MIVKIQWATGWAEIDFETFFPTSVTKARKIFELMAKDTEHNFYEVREYFAGKVNYYLDRAGSASDELNSLKEKYFENGLWYGDCVGNEKKAKYLEKEITNCKDLAKKYDRYIELFDKYSR